MSQCGRRTGCRSDARSYNLVGQAARRSNLLDGAVEARCDVRQLRGGSATTGALYAGVHGYTSGRKCA